MECVIFRHDGLIEGYIGDAVLANFGFPDVGKKDVSNALFCAYDLLSAAQHWNNGRAAKGMPAINIGIGLHYGPVVLGDAGSEEYVEFTVIGDTVNIASRLQQATRALQCDLVVGRALVDASKQEDEAAVAIDLLGRLHPHGDLAIRGRSRSVAVSTFAMPAAVTGAAP